jgi:flagellar hook-basal body complex protein FliE
VDIHDVMIAVQAESLLFQVGLQVRNKLVEAYHEVFRMQV